MVSDFIKEVDGYLRYEDKEAWVMTEHQVDGYWNNSHMVEQVNLAMDIFERKYPQCKALFIFDNAPLHMKKPDDAINADVMNVKPGGKQPVMWASLYYGEVQEMTLPDGTPKGMKIVLEERGVCTKKVVKEDMIAKLKACEDFENSKTII